MSELLKAKANNSMSTFTYLGLLFITLKLLHVVSWSWWYVTMPFWIPLGVGVFLLVVAGIVEVLAGV